MVGSVSGVNVELDSSSKLIGIEFFNTSAILKDVIETLDKRIKAA